MSLEDIGYNEDLRYYVDKLETHDQVIGRVIAEHKERYVIQTIDKELEAEVTGNLRFRATERADFPAVGDWVILSVFDNSLGIIHEILPRKSLLERSAVGKYGEKQIIGSNIDFALIVMAVDRDFNINRLERYMNLTLSGNVEPIVLLSKTDLVDETKIEDLVNKIRIRHKSIKIIPFSNLNKKSYLAIRSQLQEGKTYCIIGSSGVGKSSLVNNLSEQKIMKTKEISTSTHKGRHVTSHRQLFLLKGGGILIDTPGMREVGVIENVEEVFDDISLLASQCRFNDCTHVHEEGCAVLEALEANKIDRASYENYLKLQRESERSNASIAERRRKDKAFGKMVKATMKNKRRNT